MKQSNNYHAEINKLLESWEEVTFDGYYTSSDGKISQSNRYVKFNKKDRRNEYATKELVEASLPLLFTIKYLINMNQIKFSWFIKKLETNIVLFPCISIFYTYKDKKAFTIGIMFIIWSTAFSIIKK